MFNKPEKTDKELQDELKALCNRIVAEGYATVSIMDRYEGLLREIYKRNLTPSVTLTRPKAEKK